ncbi:MAG: iron-sulfur cluster repair di-iron protein [Bacteroidetes bacterium HGW-Bacteroidetes-2]|jgi:regulator of cell morphogenesis and NO signaling|nr:MAG: iron-sulfur cluster repair di-iron protein [Bacteroidetes bacterium HGW-Bacteroidetes-2]
MESIANKTVAEIVAHNIKTAHVFKKHGIDFCCGGGISIQKASEKSGTDLKELVAELLQVENTNSARTNYDQWDLDFLADHIVNVHHKYVEESIPLVLQYAQRVAKVHGHHYSEVIEIKNIFIAIAQELSAHMKKEELILFPFIKKLATAERTENTLTMPHFGTVDNPIAMMESEHETVGDLLKEIAQLSNHYTPPEDACNTFRALYSILDEFEQDLHQHIHLENNILFPKAKQLEKQLVN